MKSILYVFACIAAMAFANPVTHSALVIHETLPRAPPGFVRNGPAPPQETITLRLALVSNDFPSLEKALYSVSDPASPEYGQHLSKDQVEDFVRPTDESTKLVNDWLTSNGISDTAAISPAGEWLSVNLLISKANEMLNAQFSVFTNTRTGEKVTRTLSYSIPPTLKGHLEFVHPTVSFAGSSVMKPSVSMVRPHPQPAPGPSASCGSSITPACVQSLYGVPTTPATQSNNVLAVAGFIDQYANNADLESFLTQFRPDMSSSTNFSLQTPDGGQNLQDPDQAGVEANLDIQYTVGVATGVPVTFVSVGDTTQDGDLEGFLDILNYLLNGTMPTVLTTSYGFYETDMTAPLGNKLCAKYAEFGARGASVLFASGDGGVSGAQSQDCTTFVPTFPSGCPYLTSVGATQGNKPESAADFSSGGFSNLFAMPDYQSGAVKSFMKSLGSKYSGLYNTTGRGFPDVSATGVNVQIVTGGSTTGVDGTSCSSPIFASVVGLVNDRLMAAGKSPMGFLNPFIYSDKGAAAFTDITKGNNPGCNTQGFSAVKGWDPVTGMGTPNFNALLKAVDL